MFRALICEFLGTMLLLATVIGSGILAHKLDQGNAALSVLCVAVATGCCLSAAIFALGHISAHFNPIVTFASALRREFPWRNVLPYWVTQTLGACAGVILANLMFDLPAVAISETVRSGAGQLIGEFVATFGLLAVLFGCARSNASVIPAVVPMYVTGAIMFTSSTCFANPAVTISRILTNTLCGIRPDCVFAFIAVQAFACVCAVAFFGYLFKTERSSSGDKEAHSSTSSPREHRELAGTGRR